MRIKEKREEKGMTQLELTKMINVAQNTVSQWETGEREPRIDMLKRLADIFGCTVDELIEEDRVKHMNGARPREVDSARVIQVIETKSLRGTGTTTDKVRFVTQYWDFEGNLLAESDPMEKENIYIEEEFSLKEE